MNGLNVLRLSTRREEVKSRFSILNERAGWESLKFREYFSRSNPQSKAWRGFLLARSLSETEVARIIRVATA
jgi:hypothetical protein